MDFNRYVSTRNQWLRDSGYLWYVSYRNQGKGERSPNFESMEEAQKCGDLLKEQGATHISVKPGS